MITVIDCTKIPEPLIQVVRKNEWLLIHEAARFRANSIKFNLIKSKRRYDLNNSTESN